MIISRLIGLVTGLIAELLGSGGYATSPPEAFPNAKVLLTMGMPTPGNQWLMERCQRAAKSLQPIALPDLPGFWLITRIDADVVGASIWGVPAVQLSRTTFE